MNAFNYGVYWSIFCVFFLMFTDISNADEGYISQISVVNPTYKPGYQEMQFTFYTHFGCPNLNVVFESSDNLVFYGDHDFNMSVEGKKVNVISFQVEIPPSDTTTVSVRINGCKNIDFDAYSFLASEDTVLYHKGPFSPPEPQKPITWVDKKGCSTFVNIYPCNQPKPDSVIYEFVIDLRDQKAYEHFQSKLQSYFDPIIQTDREGFYIIRTSKHIIGRLKGEGIEGKLITPNNKEDIYDSFEK